MKINFKKKVVLITGCSGKIGSFTFNNLVEVITRKGYTVNDTIQNIKISKDEIYEYISLNPIKQIYKPNEKMAESDLLESYIM